MVCACIRLGKWKSTKLCQGEFLILSKNSEAQLWIYYVWNKQGSSYQVSKCGTVGCGKVVAQPILTDFVEIKFCLDSSSFLWAVPSFLRLLPWKPNNQKKQKQNRHSGPKAYLSDRLLSQKQMLITPKGHSSENCTLLFFPPDSTKTSLYSVLLWHWLFFFCWLFP